MKTEITVYLTLFSLPRAMATAFAVGVVKYTEALSGFQVTFVFCRIENTMLQINRVDGYKILRRESK